MIQLKVAANFDEICFAEAVHVATLTTHVCDPASMDYFCTDLEAVAPQEP